MKFFCREVLAYLSLFVATTFINKYVLSVLRFTYPTIFQGWQTLVGTLLLRVLIQSGRVHVDLSAFSRATVAPWIPAMMLYLVGIYSGSVALSKLPVPVFLSLHNVIYIFGATGDVIHSATNISLRKYSMLMVILITVIFISWSDTEPNTAGYFWVCIHIMSVGLIVLYESLARNRIKLGDFDKMYLNYMYSVAVLVPCTYFLGDAMAAKHFQFWYYYKFYAGCVLSGVCGVFLMIYRVKCKDLMIMSNVEELTCIAKIVASLLSLVFFPYSLNSKTIISIAINLSAGVLLHQENSIGSDPNAPHSEDEKKMEYVKPNHLLKSELTSEDEDVI